MKSGRSSNQAKFRRLRERLQWWDVDQEATTVLLNLMKVEQEVDGCVAMEGGEVGSKRLHVRSFFDETTARIVVEERQEKLLVQVEERDLSRVVSLEIEVLSRGNPHEVVAVRPGIEGEWGSTVWVGKDVERVPELAAMFKWVSRGSYAFGNDLSSMTRASKRFAIAVGVPRRILMVLLLLVVAKVARRVVEVTSELFVRVREAVRVVEERGILGR
jgi:hypothetical protein